MFISGRKVKYSGSFFSLLIGAGLIISTVNARSQTCFPAPTGLVSWYAGESNALDSLNVNSGALHNVTFATGEVGQAFSFNGSNSYVSIPAGSTLNLGTNNGFTIECWIKPTNASKSAVIVEWNNGTGGLGVQIAMSIPGFGNAGSLFANVTDTGGTSHTVFSHSSTLITNAFQHIALTYAKSNNTAILYYNGQSVVSQSFGAFTPQTAYALYIGARITDSSLAFGGQLDEVSFYGRALAASEVAQIYTAGSYGKCVPVPPPVITTQPSNHLAKIGDTVLFSVAATGSALSYQWQLNSAIILNATNSLLTLNNVQTNMAGNYSVIVSNSGGAVLSSNALLTVSSGCYTAPSNLVSWYAAEGNAFDKAGLNSGTLSNVTFAPGEVGQAFSMNGSSGYIKIPASASLNVGTNSGMTMECWIKPADLSRGQALVEWESGTGIYAAQLCICDPQSGGAGSVFANFATAAGVNHYFYTASGLLNTNSFQHVAATYDKTTGQGTIYLNGQVVASQAVGIITPGTTFYVNIGGRFPETSFFYNGLLDEVSIYGRALTASEIQSIYFTGSFGKCDVPPPPPVIVSQPVGQIANIGDMVSFSVAAAGSALNYQWQFNSASIPNATNATLTLNNVQTTQGGNYSVVVSSPNGTVASSNALLTVITGCYTAPSNLVSWYAAEGNAFDKAGLNSGSLSNVTFVPGEVGQAFSMNGSSSYIKIPASASLNVGTNSGMTMECWIKPADLSRGQALVEWENGTGAYGAQLCICDPQSGGTGSVFANFPTTAGINHYFYSASGLLNTNSFQHVAATYDKSTGQGTIYLNGQVVASQALGIFAPSTTFYVDLGGRFPQTSFFYRGLLDEVSIYGRALTASEIQSIYLTGNFGKCDVPPPPPVIVSQPVGQFANIGDTVLFSVNAAGSALNYQWQFNSASIPNATNAILTLNNVQTNQVGNYSVVVSNVSGTMASSNAVLKIYGTCTLPDAGLVAWFPAEGNAIDSISGNGTTHGGLTYATGKVGQAFSFNGSNSYVSIPPSASLNVGTNSGLTIECWISPIDLVDAQALAEWNDGNRDLGVQFFTSVPGLGNAGSLFCNLSDVSGNSHFIYTGSGILTSNTFQHVAVTYDKTSGIAKLYCNGIVQQTAQLGAFTPLTTYQLNFGARLNSSGGESFYNGLLDEPSLYNRALSDSEIQTIFLNGSAGKMCLAPNIVIQPQSQTIQNSNNASFTVGAQGSAPLSFQWYSNSVPLIGATNATLNFTNAVASYNTNLYVVASNSLGKATSSVVSLQVLIVQIIVDGTTLSNGFYQTLAPVTVQLQNAYSNGDIFYTLDGSTPTLASAQYNGSFMVTQTSTINALGYSPDFSQSAVTGPVTISVVPGNILDATTPGGGSISVNLVSTNYLPGTVVTVSATPSNGWAFLQWQGDLGGTNPVQSVVMSRSKSVQAVFGTTVSNTAAGGGSVVFNPPSGVYPYGTALRVIGVPTAGNMFSLWGNAVNSSVNPLTFYVTNATSTISSLFTALSDGKVSLAVVPVGHGLISISPQSNSYPAGQSIILTATPDAGKSFLGWAGSVTNTQNPLMITLNQSEVVYANFTTNHLLSLQLGPGTGTSEGVELDLNGEPGIHYRLDGSSNLVDWVALLNLTNYVGDIHYIDTNAVTAPYRFYRAVVLP